MPLAKGDKLGPYEIVEPIGAGGMGEVYRARDTRLNRDVALKFSKDRFSERFEREARAVAALNHPHICQLYDVATSPEGFGYLVMELVEGDNLSGPLPLGTAVDYARQIAEAIEAAHEKGIVHRDLKPANIKITPNGTVKVLDFGLAKALQEDVPSPPSQDSPTLSMAMTRAGMILGTAAYMSPEQAKGKTADRRADIWAFGVVLFEMLAGGQTFTGETAAETLASVLKEPIDFDRLPQETPPAVRHLLSRCLQRDLRKRLQAIGEARIILEGPLEGPLTAPMPTAGPAGAPPPRAAAWTRWLPWAVSAVLLVALAAALIRMFQPAPPPAIARFFFPLGEGQVFLNRGRLELAISPDGTQIVYSASHQLYLRSLPELEGRPIPGTSFNRGLANVVFSPDGKSLAFTGATDTEGAIKRIAVSGGAAVTICPFDTAPTGISWSQQGILFAESGKGILRVSPNGGTPETLVAAKAGEEMESPQMLPGGKAVLFTLASVSPGNAADWDKAQIVVQTLKSGARKVVVQGGSDARYLPTGHLVYALGGVLFAVPFDVRRLETTGGPVGIVEGVARGVVTDAAQFAFSSNGSLIYVPGPLSPGAAGGRVLGLADLVGDAQPLKVPPANYVAPRVSRDGKRVAYEIDDGKDVSVWIYDLSGATAPRRLTLPGTGANRDPIWSADNQWVAFQSDREGDLGIWRQRADGNGAAERLTKPPKGVSDTPDSWSPDGQYFSFTETKDNTSEIWTYSMRDKKASVFASLPGVPLSQSVFSPDGHWVAYQFARNGGSRIYVRPFPPTATVYVAEPGDPDPHDPVWSPDGKELFYTGGPTLFGSMSIATQPGVTFGAPVHVPKQFPFNLAPTEKRGFDMLPDGKRFIGSMPAAASSLLSESGSAASAPQIQVVLNWFEDVKQRVPVK